MPKPIVWDPVAEADNQLYYREGLGLWSWDEKILISAITSIMVMLGFAALLLMLSSWLFMGERLITARITLGRKKGSEA